MKEEKQCADCSQGRDCKTMYKQLGESLSPPVAGRSFIAFLTPVIVFAACIAVCEGIFGRIIDQPRLRSMVSSVISAGLTIGWILICRGRITRDKEVAEKGEQRSKQKPD